jgi:hypothetical protein
VASFKSFYREAHKSERPNPFSGSAFFAVKSENQNRGLNTPTINQMAKTGQEEEHLPSPPFCRAESPPRRT